MTINGVTAEKHFIDAFNVIQCMVHDNARNKGWWDSDRSDGEIIALMHSELSEALEALRDGDMMSAKIPMHKEVEEELADVIIRIMDYAERRGYNIASAIVEKHKVNLKRPHKHGKRF